MTLHSPHLPSSSGATMTEHKANGLLYVLWYRLASVIVRVGTWNLNCWISLNAACRDLGSRLRHIANRKGNNISLLQNISYVDERVFLNNIYTLYDRPQLE